MLNKIKTGDPLRIPAEVFNTLVDMTREFQERRHSAAGKARREFGQAGIVLVRNDSGQDRSRFEVLGLKGPIIEPSANLDAFRDRVALRGVVPEARHTGRFAILLEPTPAGALGRAVVDGVCAVRVQMAAENHCYADVQPGATAQLVSGTSGSAYPLWVQPAAQREVPDIAWAIVRIGAPGTCLGSCIARQPLGLGNLEYMIYPPFSLTLSQLTSTVLPGRSALVGAIVDRFLGLGSGIWTPEGIERTWEFRNLDATGALPFLVGTPHHQYIDQFGVPWIADSIDLRGFAPPAGDGVWYWANPAPVVLPNRIFESPLWHDAGTNPIPPNPALDSYDYVHDVTTQMQAFCNLKASLEFYGSPPNQQIRMVLRIYFVVLCGLQADYNFYPPITWNEGGLDLIACQKTIEVSGQGPCRRSTPTGDIASLPCCYCYCTQAGNLCWAFRFGLNALHCYGAYAVCVPNGPNYVWEFPVHGKGQRYLYAPWPYPATSEEVTLARLQEAFGFTSELNQWIAERFADRFTNPPPQQPGFAIANNSSPDLSAYPDTSISARVLVPEGVTMLGEPEEPACLGGDEALPTASPTLCFPDHGSGPVIPKFKLTSLDGWLAQVAHLHQYITTFADMACVQSNVWGDCNALPEAMREYLKAWTGNPFLTFPSSFGLAFEVACLTYWHWQSLMAGVLALLQREWTDLPLINHTECAMAIPGYDPDQDEWLFGYPWRTKNLWDPAGAVHRERWHCGYHSLEVWRATDLYPPDDPAAAAEWELLSQGGMTRTSTIQHPLPLTRDPALEAAWAADVERRRPARAGRRAPPAGLRGPCGADDPGDCSILTDQPDDPDFMPLVIPTQNWPRVYHQAEPTIIIGIKLEQCTFRLRVYFLDWIVQAITYYFYGFTGPPSEGFGADQPGEEPALLIYPLIEIGMGAKTGVLPAEHYTHMISSLRTMGRCRPSAPEPITICGEGNACQIWL